ncbi:MAG: DUF1428 domain-containing protein [Hyphomicrobiales bacterium]|nr:DUF1428 domain-containing protein [Hyphomicrobiales bacterium]
MYIDGMVCAVPTAKKKQFETWSKAMAPIFSDHGARQIVDCWGDDVPEGKVTSFPMAVKKKADETVVLSWIVWPDKKTRDAGMKAAMEDPRMPKPGDAMPFDGQRLIFGGFEAIATH